MKILAKNKRARYDYEIIKTYVAGISLLGTEIKSIRDRRLSLVGSFVSVRNGEAWWKGGMINKWECAGKSSHDERRERKLLLHAREIKALTRALDEKGNTCIVLSLGLSRGRAKLELATAKGKKKYDKRESIKQRDIKKREKIPRF